MRRINALITPIMVGLLLVHVVVGCYEMMGQIAGGAAWLKILTYILLALTAVHVAIGCVLTAQTFQAQSRAGVAYPRENRLFWARRLSGFALLVFMVVHILIFVGRGSGTEYRLNYFGPIQLAAMLMFVLSLVVHVLSNVRPLLVSLGIPRLKGLEADILAVVSVILLLAATSFVGYYLFWQVF